MRLAIPDLVSPSYFPAAVMVEQGFAAAEGAPLSIDQLWPIDRAVAELHSSELEFLAAPAHVVPLPGSGRWGGPRVIACISRGTFWFLVARSELGIARGDLGALAGLAVAAAPGPDLAFRMLLRDAGIDADALGIRIGLPEGIPRSPTMSFGAWAARELQRGSIDAFWANGMGAELAVQSGTGSVVLDVRRGDGPPEAFGYTFSALLASERVVSESPEVVRATVRAMRATHRALREEAAIAQPAADRLFPAEEAGLVVELLRRDTPYYQTRVDAEAVAGVTRFVREMGEVSGDLGYGDVVLTSVADEWEPQP